MQLSDRVRENATRERAPALVGASHRTVYDDTYWSSTSLSRRQVHSNTEELSIGSGFEKTFHSTISAFEPEYFWRS